MENVTPFDELPDSALIRERHLVDKKIQGYLPPVPFSAPTLWRKVKNGTFPKPVKVSARITAWRVSDIRAWLANLQN